MNDKPRRPRRPAGSRNFPVTSDVSGAFDTGRSDVQDLKQEIEDWKSSLESNNMEHLPKYEELEECYGYLETASDALEGVEPPECVQGVSANFTIDTRTSANSRSGRLQNAMNALDAAKSSCEAWLDENEELEATDTEDEDAPKEGEAGFVSDDDVSEREQQRSDVEEFQNELENAYSELENVGFPGMY